MCSGTLDISSSPEGTIAVIHIPVKMLKALMTGNEKD